MVRRKGRCCRKEGEIRSNGLNIHRDVSSRSKYRAATGTDATAMGSRMYSCVESREKGGGRGT